VEIPVTRDDKPTMLRAKVWAAVRASTREILAGGRSPETLAELIATATALGERALVVVSPTPVEDPGKTGWQTPGCTPGCHYCCYEQVNVTPPEVFAIAGYIRTSWSDGRQRSFRKRLRAAAAKARGLGHDAYFKARIACPLLNAQGMCSIYEVRPLMCRAYNSLDVKACERAARNADRPARERGVRANGSIHGIMDGVFGGLRVGLEAEHLQDFLPTLVTALESVLDRPALRERWLDGEQVLD